MSLGPAVRPTVVGALCRDGPVLPGIAGLLRLLDDAVVGDVGAGRHRDGLEVGILESLLGRRSLVRVPPEHVGDEFDAVRRRRRDDAGQRRRRKLRKLEVHGGRQPERFRPVSLVRRAENGTNFEDLVDLRVSGKQGSEGVQLGHDAADGPDVDRRRVHR